MRLTMNGVVIAIFAAALSRAGADTSRLQCSLTGTVFGVTQDLEYEVKFESDPRGFSRSVSLKKTGRFNMSAVPAGAGRITVSVLRPRVMKSGEVVKARISVGGTYLEDLPKDGFFDCRIDLEQHRVLHIDLVDQRSGDRPIGAWIGATKIAGGPWASQMTSRVGVGPAELVLRGESHLVWASAPGFETVVQRVTSVSKMRIEMRPCLDRRVLMQDSSTKPIRRATIHIVAIDDLKVPVGSVEALKFETDANGMADFPNLYRGECPIVIDLEAGRRIHSTVDTSDDSEEITIRASVTKGR
jgi:hypothetical protein